MALGNSNWVCVVGLGLGELGYGNWVWVVGLRPWTFSLDLGLLDIGSVWLLVLDPARGTWILEEAVYFFGITGLKTCTWFLVLFVLALGCLVRLFSSFSLKLCISM